MSRSTCVTAVAGLALALQLVAVDAGAQYRIDSWTVEHGLPTNSVTAVRQSKDGFLWFTTYGGLVRFDGTRLRVFHPDNTPGLRTSRLIGLYESRDGALWLVTEALGAVRFVDGQATTYTVDDGLPSNAIAGFFELADGSIFADTGAGVARWTGQGFERVSGWPVRGDPAVRILSRSADGTTWYRDAKGLHRFSDGRITRTVALGAETATVVQAYEDRAGRLWVQTLAQQTMGPAGRRIAQVINGALVHYGRAHGVPEFHDIAWSEDRDGTLWLGLRGDAGLLRVEGERFQLITERDGLPGRNVEAVMQDREGTMWAPTDGGLARLTAKPIVALSMADGLETENTYTTYEDRRGNIWIGGWPGLSRISNGRVYPMSRALGIAGQNVSAMFEDRDDVLWIGIWADGLRRVRGTQVETVPSPVGVVVRAIHQRKTGEIWFGGSTGLAMYTNGRMQPVPGFPGHDVLALHEDQAGTIWIGTDSGVIQYRDGAFVTFGPADGLTGTPIVRAIHEDRDGAMWFGTYDNGLFRYQQGRFTQISMRHGLHAPGAFAIVEDDEDRFWISSNSGIYRVSRRELHEVADGRRPDVMSVAYGVRDGMRHVECNGGMQPAGMRSRDGRIWFPTQRGVAIIDPRALPVNTQAPPVVITSVAVANQPVDTQGPVVIPPGSTAFEVQFAALTFVRPEQSRFRYRMEGLDTSWTEAGNNGVATYAQLPYGDFTFRVIAANRDGIWNDVGASLPVKVIPPFWRTTWFLTLLLSAAVVVGLVVHNWRMGLLRREKALQQAFSRELLESQEEERQRIAAGLHDGLQQHLVIIKNWALMGPTQERMTQIETVAGQALGEVREIVYDLTPYQLEHLGLTRTLVSMVEKLATSSGVNLECHSDDVDGVLSREAEVMVFRVVQEATNNLLKHAQASRGVVRVERREDAVVVEVNDDGRGFVPAAGTGEAGRSGGFGIFGMAQRVQAFGGTCEVRSAPGQGTTVTVRVPR